MDKTAVISECGKYRYSLTRKWDERKPVVMFLMLNPSTADANNDDPTIRRCIGFAESWGYGSLVVCNLFAFRATNPKMLLNVSDPVGPDNLLHFEFLSQTVDTIICAWGNSIIVDKICPKDYKLLKNTGNKLRFLELSKNGTPKHPLYLKKNLKPLSFPM